MQSITICLLDVQIPHIPPHIPHIHTEDLLKEFVPHLEIHPIFFHCHVCWNHRCKLILAQSKQTMGNSLSGFAQR